MKLRAIWRLAVGYRRSLYLRSIAADMVVTERALAAGSAFPVLEPGTLRLYSMRFCPFAQRSRLVLAHKNIPYETVNINLKQKPEWFLERNPLGLVPVLEQNDKVVYESPIVSDYLEDLYPEPRLYASDPYQRARDRILVDTFSAVTTPFTKLVRSKGEDKDAVKEANKALDRYEQELRLRGDFFGGKKVNIVDLMIWPWFERWALLKDIVPEASIDQKSFPHLASWIDRMLQTDAVKQTLFDAKTHHAFFKSYMDGSPDYDIGIDAKL